MSRGTWAWLKPRLRVGLLGQYLAADKIAHDDRHQRDGERGGGGHGVGLGVGQAGWAPLLRLQGKHRQEAHGDDEQGRKSPAPTSMLASPMIRQRFLSVSASQSMCLWTFSIITIAPSTMAPMAMAIPQRHDVGVDPTWVHHDKAVKIAIGG